MLLDNPVRGVIKPHKRFYPLHPEAVRRVDAPAAPLITQGFGPTAVAVEPTVVWPGGELDIFGNPIKAKTYPNFHRGIDISKGGCVGVILAAADGEVIRSKRNLFQTEIIVVDHGVVGGHRFKTIYGHLGRRDVRAGDTVVAGQAIGTLGNSGVLSTGCHLHFAVKRNGRFVDPWRRLRQRTSVDPDQAASIEPSIPAEPDDDVEESEMPVPASDNEYLAGRVAFVGNTSIGAVVRTSPRTDGAVVRTVPGGTREKWLPTCWVIGDTAFNSDRWLARWFKGQWEFTHSVNVEPITSPTP